MIKTLQYGFEVLLILLVLIFAYTQLVRPLVRKTPVFPMFRKRPNLEREMEEVAEAAEVKAEQAALVRQKRKLGAVASSAVKND